MVGVGMTSGRVVEVGRICSPGMYVLTWTGRSHKTAATIRMQQNSTQTKYDDEDDQPDASI